MGITLVLRLLGVFGGQLWRQYVTNLQAVQHLTEHYIRTVEIQVGEGTTIPVSNNMFGRSLLTFRLFLDLDYRLNIDGVHR